MTSVIEFRGATRRFGRVVALDAVDFVVAPGAVVGLAGRNGAGKTTALRLALGLLWADAGEVRTLGLDPRREGAALRRRVSILSEESSLYGWMTVAETLAFAARVHPCWDPALAKRLAGRLELDPRAKVAALSRGGKAKLSLALAAAPRPELLLLDDPTAGLDPLARREVLQEIVDAVPAAGAVVYATHLVADLERMADEVVFLDAGRVALAGGVEELKRRVKRHEAVFDGEAPAALRPPGAIDVRAEGRALVVVADGENGAAEAALRAAGARSVETTTLPLEEIAVALLRGGRPESGADDVWGEVEHV